MRFGAGFGSQIALSFVRKCEIVGERIDGDVFFRWVRNLANSDDVEMRIWQNKLVAYVDGSNNLHGGVQGEHWEISQKENITQVVVEEKKLPDPEPQTEAVADNPEVTKSVSKINGDISETVIGVVVEHTGYPADFVELDQDLEGELGIDTVKQAEIMADIRSKFGLPVDEDFVLSDYPTLNHMIGYIKKMSGELPVRLKLWPLLLLLRRRLLLIQPRLFQRLSKM